MKSEGALIDFLKGSLEIIRYNCQAHRAGCFSCYRVLATQLRILLCDRKKEHGTWKETSILPIIFPGITLPRIVKTKIVMTGGKGEPSGLFNLTDSDHLPISDWLEQVLWDDDRKQTKIRQLIKWVAEKDGGAHVDLSGAGWMQASREVISETIYQVSCQVYDESVRLLEVTCDRPDR